jgi:hydroxymethylpyrimidine/phosphomethylpyrimidine kinase
MQLKTALTIAGSDPSGGAGIQADLKTFSILGVYGGAVITCNTVQNTTGVRSYHPVRPDLVRQQIAAVLDDLDVSHIKIGMVGSLEIAGAILEALKNFQGEIIWDPVMRASSGHMLTNDAEIPQLLETLAAKVTILTPNLPELAILTQKDIPGFMAMQEAALSLFGRYASLRTIIIKGGHQLKEGGLLTDYLVRRGKPAGLQAVPPCEIITAAHPHIQTRNDHGTGCTFASAFTAFHMLTGSESVAFRKTTAFLHELLTLSTPYRIGHGRGPLLHHLFRLTPSA